MNTSPPVIGGAAGGPRAADSPGGEASRSFKYPAGAQTPPQPQKALRGRVPSGRPPSTPRPGHPTGVSLKTQASRCATPDRPPIRGPTRPARRPGPRRAPAPPAPPRPRPRTPRPRAPRALRVRSFIRDSCGRQLSASASFAAPHRPPAAAGRPRRRAPGARRSCGAAWSSRSRSRSVDEPQGNGRQRKAHPLSVSLGRRGRGPRRGSPAPVRPGRLIPCRHPPSREVSADPGRGPIPRPKAVTRVG